MSTPKKKNITSPSQRFNKKRKIKRKKRRKRRKRRKIKREKSNWKKLRKMKKVKNQIRKQFLFKINSLRKIIKGRIPQRKNTKNAKLNLNPLLRKIPKLLLNIRIQNH